MMVTRDDLRARISKLSAEQQALLRRRLQGGSVPDAPAPVNLRPRSERGPAPLSFGQQRLWFLDQLDAASPAYNEALALRLSGPPRLDLLAACFDELVRRHEILRTTFALQGEQPVQIVHERMTVTLAHDDLEREFSENSPPDDWPAAIREHVQHPFDLQTGPLFRVGVFQHTPRESLLIVVMHHIVTDGWSLRILLGELARLYDAATRGTAAELPPLPVQYADYAAWQREPEREPALQPGLEFWKKRLLDAPADHGLPFDRPPSPKPANRSGVESFAITSDVASRFADLARQSGCSAFVTLLTTFAVLLHRHTRGTDLVIGTPVANRTRREVEPLIGFFVNTLALRLDLAGNPTFAELLRRTRQNSLEALTHQETPFERIVEALNPKRALDRNPLFQVVFTLQENSPDSLAFGDLAAAPVFLDAGTAKFDLTLNLDARPGRLLGRFEFNRDLFDPATIRRLARSYQALLAAVAFDPAQRLDDLSVATLEEQQTLLRAWNDTAAPFDRDLCLHRLFERQALVCPAALALVCGAQSWSYAGLESRANRWAHGLRSRGVGPEMRVGICLERGPAMIVAVLAVLKAGGPYVPLDPAYPQDRLQFMQRDSGCALVLTRDALAPRLAGPGAAWLDPEREFDPPGLFSAEPPAVTLDPASAAYLIYTSGSTGQPKAVVVAHRSVVNLAQAQQTGFRISATQRVAQFASLGFDASVSEMWTCFGAGATLVLATDDDRGSPASIHAFLSTQRINVVTLPPTVWALLPAALPDLQSAISAGERCPAEIVRRWSSPHCRFYNAYGPTEITVCATLTEVASDDPAPPIGRPLANTGAWILDDRGRPAPAGVCGELYVSGEGVARGYWNRPALTAARFVPNPFATTPGERLYRTGDLARQRSDGSLEYRGRIDQQVKLRGFRIEPGEIEAVIDAHPAVKSSAVVVRTTPSGQDLAAYVVPAGATLAIPELRAHLRQRLPDYMLPAAFVVLDDLPRNTHGKIDRAALPAPAIDRRALTARYEAPADPVEALLARIWSELLRVEQVGVHDDFFEFGGHSLLAAQIMSRVNAQLGIALTLREFFENPTVAQIARLARSRDRADDDPILPVARTPAPPLSFAQEQLWFLHRLDPTAAGYNVPIALRVRGPLDLEKLERVFTVLVERHESLRATFRDEDGRPTQRFSPAAPCRIAVAQLPAFADADREIELRRWASREAARPFDLEAGPLLRVQLLLLANDDQLLLLTLHHIVTDAWSMAVLIDEMGALYEVFSAGGTANLPPLPIQYADFAAWQRTWLTEARLAPQIAYWKTRLAGVRPLDLPADFPRPLRQSYRGLHLDFALGPELSRSLKSLSRDCGATLFMTTLAAFKVLLFRYTHQEDIAVGVPVANRSRPETEGLVGFFVNPLVLRTDFADNPTFRELLGRVRQGTLEAYAHQDLPFERLVEELKLPRDPARPPLVQIMFAFQNAPQPGRFPTGLAVEAVNLETGLSKFDLTLELTETGEDIAGSFEFNRDLFVPETIERMLGHFRQLLQSIAADPGRTVGELELLPPGEKHRLLREWTGTAVPFPRDESIARLFEAQVRARPASIAVVEGTREWSYAALNEHANRLAHFLGTRGVGLETRIGVIIPRGFDLIAAVLGILKCGGVYVPLDAESPPPRLQAILADSRCRLVLGTSETRAALDGGGVPFVALDQTRDGIAAYAADDPVSFAGGDSAAYVIYTSGSTGTPKGVEVPHRAVVRLVQETNFASFGPDEVFLFHSPLAFDASTLELWGSLLHGARLCVLPPGPASLQMLADHLRNYGVTTLWLTASLFHAMVDEQLEALAGVRQVLAGGDVLLVPQVGRFRAGAPRSQLINGYGPTENTTFTCCHRVSVTEPLRLSVPIGRPITNTQVFLLDRNLQPVPTGVVGELYTGGDGLARGYVNQPALTATRFVPHPFGARPGERLYRTGDLARYLSDGTIEFVGRVDHQVKIRGFRLELGEIEAALAGHPAVKGCVVIAGPDPAGGKRVIAYAVLRRPAPLAELRAFLQGRLPGYMIPAAFVFLDALPTTSSGKVDRKRLPPPGREAEDHRSPGAAPLNPTEARLAAIWSDLLGLARVGVNENFFELGGHSLLATRVVSRIATLLDVVVELRDFFEHPTIAGLAAHLQTLKRRRFPPIPSTAREGPLPLSSAQERLWFLHRLDPASAGYNVPLALRLDGPLDVEALTAVLDALVARHESLRTTFPADHGRPQQVVHPAAGGSLALVDLESVPPGARPAEVRRLGEEEARAGFSLAEGPVFRRRLLRLDREHHVLLLTFHHIVTDGWSLGILVRELVALYAAFRAGRPNPLAPPALHYVDFARWQRGRFGDEAVAQQLAYWKKQLAGVPPLDLPADRPRPPVQTHRGAHHEFVVDAPLGRKLKQLSRDHGATLFMTLLAAFDVVLWRWCRQTDVAVGTPIANRNHPDTEELFGYFVNTLVLRSRLDPRETFADLLRRVKQTALEAYAHQDVPFDQLVEALNVVRDRSRSPLFQVMLVLQNTPMPRLALPGLAVEPVDFDTQLAKFDLTISLTEQAGDSLAATAEYNTDLFAADTIERLIASYLVVLESAAAQAAQPVGRLEFLTASDRHRLLVEWNSTAAPLPPEPSVIRIFSQQVRLRPDATALIYGGRQLTYRELDVEANRLAHVLRRRGVAPETRVGVCMERGLEMILAILAIFKAGGAYVPLDPTYPAARVAFMVEDSSCAFVIVRGRRPDALAAAQSRLVEFAELCETLAAEPADEPMVEIDAANAAYLIYTSGSTGRPKAILIPHGGIVNLQDAQRKFIGATPATRMLQFASLNFDASVLEMWITLCVGGTLIVASDEHRRSPSALADVLRSQRVAVVTLPPTLAAVLSTDLPELRTMIAAGERCPPELVRRWAGPGRQIVNAYGPSEITVVATMATLTPDQPSPPIGAPLTNVFGYVVAPDGALAPPGVPGELYIGGVGVSRGYWTRPGLTAEAYVPDPFSGTPGARLYRTGDLVRHLPDGQFDFLGRLDDQIKIRGMRVELGEIENVLAQHPRVRHCAVICTKDARGDDRLAAYVVSRERVTRNELQSFLKTKLPDHMIPSAVAFLDALPINPSGKVDRRALPAISVENPAGSADFRPPRNPIELALADDWRAVLDLDQVGTRDNFFEIGGNSMKVVQLFERFERRYPRTFTIGDLFDLHTIEQQAERIAPAVKSDPGVPRKPRRLTI